MLLLCSYGIIVMLLKSTILKSFLSYNNVEGSYKCAKIQIFIWLCNNVTISCYFWLHSHPYQESGGFELAVICQIGR